MNHKGYTNTNGRVTLGVASIAWLRKECSKSYYFIVNLILAYNIFTMHWDKDKLEQLDSATQAGFELLLMITDQYQQKEQSEHLIRWKEESYVVQNEKDIQRKQ